MQEKLAITVIVITLALFALIYILYNIIQGNKDRYNQIVLSQQEYDSRVIPYRRGDIVDRNGTLLATTEKVYNLIIDPSQIIPDPEDHANLEATIAALSATYGYDIQELRTLILENSGKAYVRYARQLSYEEKETFEKLTTETNTANRKSGTKVRIKGVWFEDEYKRVYPYNSLACNVLGFATSAGDAGTGGIEQSYNDQLIGINGREYGYLNDDSNLERVIKSATNGNTVVSTIDVNVQNIVDKYIAEWMSTEGSDRVGVVVMDPNSGEVLAMSSDILFDLNDPRNLEGRYTDAEIRELGLTEAKDTYNRKNRDARPITEAEVTSHYSEEEIKSFGQQVAWNQVWRNFCISDTFEPGSPSKIFTVAAGLEEAVISENDSFFCDGFQEVGGWQIKCVKRTGHGMLTLAESLMQSCNDCMMQIAAKEGRETFSKYMQSFGFGNKTGIDLPGEADTRTLIYNASNMKPSDLATNSFGQNYNCTMIQMAAAYASVINGGSYYEPHVVKQIVNDQDAIVKRVEPNLVRETVSESTSNFIKDALYRTVEEGTGTAAIIEGYEIAGKTGTAEKYPRGRGNYLLSFCGFAPAYNPQVLVYVVIDTPHVEDQARSIHASRLFQKITHDILPYLNIFPTGDFEDVQDEIAAQLPAEEGISGNNGGLEPETAAETKVYETDEYVEPEDERDTGIPGDLPGDESSGSGDSTESSSEAERMTEAAEEAAASGAVSGPGGTTSARDESSAAETSAAGTTAAQTSETQSEPGRQESGEGERPGQIPVVDPNPS